MKDLKEKTEKNVWLSDEGTKIVLESTLYLKANFDIRILLSFK